MGSWTRLLTPILAAVVTVAAIGQEPAAPKYPEVDTAEVLRRGNAVVIAGEGPRGAAEDAMIQATAPPPDDSYKWFIVVIKQQNCQPCAQLLSDFQRTPELLAFVTATEPYKPWGHFLVYDRNDATQQYRLKEYRVAGTPTIVIQPPLNGVWGPPGTVVWQTTGYDGNPKALAANITKYVRAYAAAMGRKGYPRPPQANIKSEKSIDLSSTASRFRIPSVEGGAKQQDGVVAAPVSGPPPFNTPPKVDPFNVFPIVPSNPMPAPTPDGQWPPKTPDVQPTPNPAPTPQMPGWVTVIQGVFSLFSALATGNGTTNLLLLIITGMKIMERIAPLTPAKWDDAIVAIYKKFFPNGIPSIPVVVQPGPVPVPAPAPTTVVVAPAKTP